MLLRSDYFYFTFIFCSTFCFFICKGSVITVIEKELMNTDQLKYEVSLDIRILSHEIEAQNEECDKRVRTMQVNTHSRDREFQDLVKVIATLWADINLMQSRKERIIETINSIEKLQIGIHISATDVLQLKERRRNGLTSKCLILEGMAPAVRVPRNSLSGKDSPDEAIMVLENRLQAAQSKLSKLLLEKMEKSTRKKVNEAVCVLKLKRLREAVQKLNNNSEAVATVDLLAIELEYVKMEVKELARSALISLKNVNMDVLKSDAKKQERVQKQFISEKLCYAKLTEHLRWDESTWKLGNEPWLKKLIY